MSGTLFREEGDYLYLNLSQQTVCQAVFRAINNGTTLSYVTYKGKKYYERSNMWDGITIRDDQRDPDDPNIECSRYMDGCNAPAEILPENESDVKYAIKFMFGRIDINDEEDYSNILTKIKEYGRHNIKFEGFNRFNRVRITNRRGPNEDHRGSTHCKIYLQMHDCVFLERDLTFKDLAIAFYKLKSHKFDKWYELYCNLELRKIRNILEIALRFDHGS